MVKKRELLQLLRAELSLDSYQGLRGLGSESRNHFLVKMILAYDAHKAGHPFWIEPRLTKSGCRPDLIILTNDRLLGVEVVESEKEDSLVRKKKKYPSWLEMRVVRAEHAKTLFSEVAR